MVSLLYLKHAFNLSDEELVERWGENVVWQFFSGHPSSTVRARFRGFRGTPPSIHAVLQAVSARCLWWHVSSYPMHT